VINGVPNACPISSCSKDSQSEVDSLAGLDSPTPAAPCDGATRYPFPVLKSLDINRQWVPEIILSALLDVVGNRQINRAVADIRHAHDNRRKIGVGTPDYLDTKWFLRRNKLRNKE
jgi:hypothetical protein